MILTFLLSCSSGEEVDNKNELESADTPSTNKIVVYSGRGESMVSELFEMAEEDLGFSIEVQYGDTSNMVTKMLTEGDQSPADIIFAQSSGYLGALSKQDRLETLSDELLNSIESKFRDDEKKWIGISGRLRVLVYDSSKIKDSEMPSSLKDLSDPIWKGRLVGRQTTVVSKHMSVHCDIFGEKRKPKHGYKPSKQTIPKYIPKTPHKSKLWMKENWRLVG